MTNSPRTAPIARRVVARQRGFNENRLWLLIMLLPAILLITSTGYDLQAMAIFCLCAVIFLIQCVLLGESLGLNHFTIPSCFMLICIAILLIPSIQTLTNLRPPIRYTYFAAIQSVLITFPLGVGLANLLFRQPTTIS